MRSELLTGTGTGQSQHSTEDDYCSSELCTHMHTSRPDTFSLLTSPPPSTQTQWHSYMHTHTHRTHIPTLNTSIPHTPPAQTSILIGTNLNYSQAFATIQYKCEQTNYKLDSGKGMHGSEANWDLTPVLVAPRTSLSLKKPLTTVTLQWTHS